VDRRHALVARTCATGTEVREIEPVGACAEPCLYFASVAAELGDRERIVVAGPRSARLALEREYTALYQRPDRIVDLEPSEPMNEQALLARLREMTAPD
jgi:hypothetical protein